MTDEQYQQIVAARHGPTATADEGDAQRLALHDEIVDEYTRQIDLMKRIIDLQDAMLTQLRHTIEQETIFHRELRAQIAGRVR